MLILFYENIDIMTITIYRLIQKIISPAFICLAFIFVFQIPSRDTSVYFGLIFKYILFWAVNVIINIFWAQICWGTKLPHNLSAISKHFTNHYKLAFCVNKLATPSSGTHSFFCILSMWSADLFAHLVHRTYEEGKWEKKCTVIKSVNNINHYYSHMD